MAILPQLIDALFAGRKKVLVSGAGGGFDVVAGLGIALALREQGHEVHLGNLSFTKLGAVKGGEWLDDVVLRVDDRCSPADSYAPEVWLSEWWQGPVHCFRVAGCRQLTAGYRLLAERLGLDGIVLVDGGVDAFLRGDEFSLGTPTWDHLSLAAASSLELPLKVAACVGFGAEQRDKICHAQALHRFADLTREGAFLGVESLIARTKIGRLWGEAVDHIHARQGPLKQSVVVDSIRAAMRGEYGEMSVNARTQQTPLWISPLMALCWYFDLDAVARAKPYLAALRETETVEEGSRLINDYNERHRTPRESIPI
jgi:hypothetical protein